MNFLHKKSQKNHIFARYFTMENFIPKPLLAKINSPEDLRKLSVEELPLLCNELRDYIIDIVSQKGGHFGASLGVVELTTALHYAYNTPEDQLIWDVGHQAYGHKILTGRRDVFPSNRIYKGISGFPKRSESVYDTFGVGHSSTSISAALGMAIANKHQNKNTKHIAVIGDGAMTAGMAFEALNHAGATDADLLVVLNDNCMSIDPNVGALKTYLTDIAVSRPYNRLKDDVWHTLGKLGKLGEHTKDLIHTALEAVKTSILREANLFESLNFRYFGPIDGHDVKHLTKVLQEIKHIPGPKLLHCITKKGKGYEPSEQGNSTFWHAPGLFDKITGETTQASSSKEKPPKFQDVFGHTLVELAEQNPKIMGITPAMPTGCSLNIMMKAMPDRAFDVGIAEQHAVTFSAGLATQGMIPFCNIYSSFMQRAYDQVIHDVALQNLHVVLCLDRGGLVGADGATHHGAFDIAYMRAIPNMIVAAPMDEIELRNMMYTAQLENKGVFSIRYPRGEGSHTDWKKPFAKMDIGTGRQIKAGKNIAILSLGVIGAEAMKATAILAQQGIEVAHYDMRFAKPLDKKLLQEIFATFPNIITLEDGCITGGFGSAVLEELSEGNFSCKVKRLGIPDQFIEHGTQTELYKECHYDAETIVQEVNKITKTK
jgi:1-deoxy-D-xylulose-5-phosphate synthase